MKKLQKLIREQLGKELVVDGKECFIVSVYPSRKPEWVMLKDELGINISWDDAINLKLPEGWKIPSKKEFEEFGKNIAFLRNSEDSNFSTDTFGFYLWSSSKFSGYFAWYLNTSDGNLDYYRKDGHDIDLRVHAFKKLPSNNV